MKIIISVAGGGRTTKVIELAMQHIKESKTVHVISGEESKDDIASLAHGKEMDLNVVEQIKFTTLSRGSDIFEVVNKDDSDVLFLDGIGICFLSENPFAEMDWEYVLKELKKIEQKKGIEIYATRQASRDNNLARTPIMIEYATQEGKNE